MARNSFMLKSLMALQVAALIAFQARNSNSDASSDTFGEPALWIVALVVIPFWYLDSYFLHQERLFRMLYECVRKRDESEIDFSMDASALSKGNLKEFRRSLFSRTLLPYYLVVLVVLLGIIFFVD